VAHADDPQELSVPTFGCSGSLIPDRRPPARLAKPKYDGLPRYRLLSQTIRSTIFSCGRFPAALRRGDFTESLIDEAVTLGIPLLDKSDEEIVSGGKSIARKLIRREKDERRWVEVIGGKKVRRSKAVLRITHPVQRADEDGKVEWVSPVDKLPSGFDGRPLGLTAANINEVEARLVEHLDGQRQILTVITTIGAENFRWALSYVERKRGGVPIPAADRDRFRRLRVRLG
jgi:hypothetical protein